MENREPGTVKLPRVAIEFCVQCKWMLRAAYFSQELLSTFSTSIGEIALIPTTGGIFTVRLTHQPLSLDGTDEATAQDTLIWDRRTEGGFPETKILKQLIRNHIEPNKKLGHSDTPSSKSKPKASASLESEVVVKDESSEKPAANVTVAKDSEKCADCA